MCSPFFSCLGHVDGSTTVGLLQVLTNLTLQYEGHPDQMEAMQNRLDTAGATHLMITLANSRNPTVAAEAVNFGIALLLGGNQKVQGSLLKIFESSPKSFFVNIVSKMQKASDELKERRRERAFVASNQQLDGSGEINRLLDNKFDLQNISSILRLLQLFCEGHYLPMQNYMRIQGAKAQSYDLVTEVYSFLKEVVSNTMDDYLLKIARQAFVTLTEFCQGPCPLNQTALVKLNIAHEANIVLSSADDEDELSPRSGPGAAISTQRFELFSDVMVTLLSLLEGCNDQYRPRLMTQTLDLDTMFVMLERAWRTVRTKTSTDGLEGNLTSQEKALQELAFNIYIFLYMLMTLSGDEQIQERLGMISGAKYFESMLGVIEIARGDSIERCYFSIPHICFTLTDDAKENLLQDIDRDSPASKVMDFFDKASGLILEMEYRMVVRNKLNQCIPVPREPGKASWPLYTHAAYPFLVWLRKFMFHHMQDGIRFWQDAVLYTAIILNALLLYTHPPHAPSPTDATSPTLLQQTCVTLLGILAFLFTLLLCGAALLVDLPIRLYRIGQSADGSDGDHGDHEIFNSNGNLKRGGRLDLKSVTSHLAMLSQLPMNSQVLYWYYLITVVASYLGLVCSPFFFSLHLLMVVNKSKLLQNVMRSITQNGKTLLLAAILGFIIVYLFAIVAYITFPESFISAEGTKMCHTLWQCLVFSVASGIRSGGGLGDLLTTPAYDEWPQWYVLCGMEAGKSVVQGRPTPKRPFFLPKNGLKMPILGQKQYFLGLGNQFQAPPPYFAGA